MSKELSGEYNLRPVWDALLETYEVFAAICEKHGLRFCADCGTALGAVRHQGFIPWDDDLDVEMPRPDYERLKEIAQKELPSGYAWLDRFNCTTYEQGFGKIIVTDAHKVDVVASKSGLPLGQGIFIDIFPLDGYPDTTIGRLWRKAQNQFYEVELALNKVLRVLGLMSNSELSRLRAHRKVVEHYEKRARNYQFGSTELCVSIGVSRAFDDKPYHHRHFGTPQKIAFDRTGMYVQENVDGYLNELFGDYMELPPFEKRHPGHGLEACRPWRLGPDFKNNKKID